MTPVVALCEPPISACSQFSPENDAEEAMLFSWLCSWVISSWTFYLSTPGSAAATSLFLISLTTSMEDSIPE